MANEIELNTHLSELDSKVIEVAGKELGLDYFICADWRSLVYELGTDPPNSKLDDAIRCWACGVTKLELWQHWWLNPFKKFELTRSIRDYPQAALDSVPLYKRRYDWMHGITNMLRNTLGLLRKECPRKQEFDDLEGLIKNGTKLQPHEMKEAFRGHKLDNIARLFHTKVFNPLPWPKLPGGLERAPRDVILLLLDSCYGG